MSAPTIRAHAAYPTRPYIRTTPLGTTFLRVREFLTTTRIQSMRATKDDQHLSAVDHLRVADTGAWV